MKSFTVLPLSYLDREPKPYEATPIVYLGRCLRSARWYAANNESPCGVVFPDGHVERPQ